MNKKLTIISVAIIAVLLTIVATNLEFVQANVNKLYDMVSSNLGILFIILNIASFIFSLWLLFSKYGKIKLGGKDAKPTYSTLSWVAMMFTTSCSAGLLTLGFTESVTYAFKSVPWGAVPGSLEACNNAMMYGFHHWGLGQWAMFVPISILAGYVLYNRKSTEHLTVSSICNIKNPILSTIVDVIAILGTVIAPVTSMGMGMPLLTYLVRSLFNIPVEYTSMLQYILLAVWMCILMFSVYNGLNKGIKKLSNFNTILYFVLIGIFVCIDIRGFLSAFVGTTGLYLGNLLKLFTYTGLPNDTAFVNGWTIWYWAWALVFIPMMGIFNAKISKGRTVRQLVLGQLVFSSLTCWIAITSIGRYGLTIGEFVSNAISSGGDPEAVLQILNTLPFSKILIALVIILCFVFLATTVDSSAFVAAELTKKDHKKDAPRYSRIFWAIISCMITIVLLKVGGFSAMQTLVLVIGVPLILVSIVVMVSCAKILKKDTSEDDYYESHGTRYLIGRRSHDE